MSQKIKASCPECVRDIILSGKMLEKSQTRLIWCFLEFLGDVVFFLELYNLLIFLTEKCMTLRFMYGSRKSNSKGPLLLRNIFHNIFYVYIFVSIFE